MASNSTVVSSDTSSQVSWPSAYWALVAIAYNSMIQPSGRICGFDYSLQIYLRSSPLVCAFDAVTIIARFLAYLRRGYDTPTAAKMVKNARESGIAAAKEGSRWYLENRLPTAMLYFGLAIGVAQVIKLTACSGVLWTKVWFWSYFTYFLLEGAMNKLAEKAPEEMKPAATNPSDETELHIQNRHSVGARLDAEGPDDTAGEIDIGEQAHLVEELESTGSDCDVEAQNTGEDDLSLERQMDRWNLCERCWGALAILLQLMLLASVDLAARPPDTDLRRRWTFRCVRMSAHVFAILIYLPLRMVLGPRELLPHLFGYLILSFVLILLFAANTHDFRFSQQYFLYSFMVSSFSWLLYFFNWTRINLLLCEDRRKGLLNVLGFDFFCRIFGFSLFWYAKIYNPTGTYKPPWADNLG